jgi:hypothetical protein
MKLQNILRAQVVVIGFTAALLLASPSPAQEIDNTTWDDGPNAAPLAQSTPATGTPATVTNELSTAAENSPAMNTAAVITQPILAHQAVVSEWAPVESWVIASSVLFIALVTLYVLAESRRAKRGLDARANHARRSTALS